MDTYGQRALICKNALSKIVRYNTINDIFALEIRSFGIPVCKKLTGLARTDGKRPDGLTMLPWEGGKPLTWDITVTSTLAHSYIHASCHIAGGAAELAASRKEAKYSCLTQSHVFQTIALETLVLVSPQRSTLYVTSVDG